jgi:hypothetical protein
MEGWGLIPAAEGFFSFCYSFQTGFGVNRFFYSMGKR